MDQRQATASLPTQRPLQQQRQQPQLSQRPLRHELYVRDSSFESRSSDHDYEEITFLEACMECDDDALYEIIRDGVTREQVNERDKSGRTGLSHACSNGFVPILELLVGLEELDPNLADNDGNTPLIYAAQAGHDDMVNYLLQNVRQVRVDQCNKMGFTSLMKAAIQGRARCAKLLLFAGASPNRRDYGRGLCAEEWARFCGCHSCANSIAKYVRSKKYFFKKTFLLSKDKWSSEPDILNCSKRGTSNTTGGSNTGSTTEKATSWIQRHLSLKRKKPRGQNRNEANKYDLNSTNESLTTANKFGSAPILLINSYEDDLDNLDYSAKNFRRPSCLDNVVPVSIGRRRPGHATGDDNDTIGANNEKLFSKNSSRHSPPSPRTGNAGKLLKLTDSDALRRSPSHENIHQPPKITVGDTVEEPTHADTTTDATTTSTIIAPSLAPFLPNKAVAACQVESPRRKAATSGGSGRSSSGSGGRRSSSSPSPLQSSEPAFQQNNH